MMLWPRPVDSGKVKIMDLEKRICLERVKFKRGQVDKITDFLSVPQPGTVLQKVCINNPDSNTCSYSP